MTPLESKEAIRPHQLPSAMVHVDLDGAEDIYEGHGWQYDHADDPIFVTGLRNFIDLFAANGIRATLFVIARSLRNPRKRALIEEAVEQGHEIASHSVTHSYLTALDSVGKRREIAQSREILESELGVRVRGFRAPGYRIDRESLEILADCGYEYDSSGFPTDKFAAALATSVSVLTGPHTPIAGSSFVEWPLPDHRPFPVPFNPSYSLLLGDWLFKWGLAKYRENGRSLALLFHLIDAAEPLAADRLRGLSSKIFTLSTISASEKLKRCQKMLDQVKSQYRIITTLEAIEEWRGETETVRPVYELPGIQGTSEAHAGGR
ncbi:MAG: polysaccharide deacetylase family protein [Gemmatimonadaceae bacterium]